MPRDLSSSDLMHGEAAKRVPMSPTRRPGEVFTPSTSTSTRASRNEPKKQDWDDPTTDSELSDDSVHHDSAHAGSPPTIKKGDHDVAERQRQQAWKFKNQEQGRSRQGWYAWEVKPADNEDWLVEFEKATRPRKDGRRSKQEVEDSCDGGDHQHCGNCGGAMDEAGRLL